MTEFRIQIEVYDYWHAGTGRGSGPILDAAVARTPAGLPRLPGKTVRGLIRDGFRQAEDFNHPEILESARAEVEARTDDVFGSDFVQGRLHVTDARLPESETFEAWADGVDLPVAGMLFESIASTAIDGSTGQAQDKTLRVVEVAVPLTLEARVIATGLDGTAEGDGAKNGLTEGELVAALGFIRGLGTQRRRGFGRSQWKLVPVATETSGRREEGGR